MWIYGLDSFGWIEYYHLIKHSYTFTNEDVDNPEDIRKKYELLCTEGPAYEFDKKVNDSNLLKTATMLEEHKELVKKALADNPQNRITDAAFKWALCSLSILSNMIENGYAELFPINATEIGYARFVYGYHWNVNDEKFECMYDQEMESIYSCSPSDPHYNICIDNETEMIYTQYRILNVHFGTFKKVEAELFKQLNFEYGRH